MLLGSVIAKTAWANSICPRRRTLWLKGAVETARAVTILFAFTSFASRISVTTWCCLAETLDIEMEKPQTYCQAIEQLEMSDVNRVYHDAVYGYPVSDDNELFGRLLLEINQAGLSWSLILNKQANFRQAYANFEVHQVARFSEADRQRLLNDPGIIRNRLKINAAIYNAQRVLDIQAEFGSFKHWLDRQGDLPKAEWVKRFKKSFKFTGGEITNEFLMSTGYLPGAHEESCPIYDKVLAQRPAWYSYKLNHKPA